LLNDKHILVTGVCGGIGRSIAKRLVREGAIVFGADMAEEAPPDLRDQIRYCRFDLAAPISVEKLFSSWDIEQANLDGLVNNAAYNVRGDILDIPVSEWDAVMNVNLRGTFLMCQHGARRMLERGGAIVNISSSAAKLGGKIAGDHYSVAKAGVNALTVLLAKEIAAYGVRVNSVCPGPISTPFHKNTTEEEKRAAVRNIPMGRFGEPREVAAVVSFLLSEDASYMTGEVLDVNGGLVMETV
jgi:3-oxoacyl-[acyl-carrier protein] reductase